MILCQVEAVSTQIRNTHRSSEDVRATESILEMGILKGFEEIDDCHGFASTRSCQIMGRILKYLGFV